MSEKEKMQTEELAKIMDDAKPLGKSALSFMAGFVQGYKEARAQTGGEHQWKGWQRGMRKKQKLSFSPFQEARPRFP